MTRLRLLILFSAFFFSTKAQLNNTVQRVPVIDSLLLQDSTNVIRIGDVIITGNKRTKDYIINREIHLKHDDSVIVGNLAKEVELARQQVHNTTLFSEVRIDPVMRSADVVDLIVTVKEKWYMYPTPQFQLVDRNFNEWLVKYKGDLSRVNYGIKFLHYNLSGRRDQLRIYLINGYSRNVSLSYVNPYSNSKLTQGFFIGGGFSQFREVGYRTTFENSISRYSNGKFIYDSWNLNGGFLLRKAIRKRHVFTVSYTHIHILDSIIQNLNPHYFNDPSTRQGLIDFVYSFQYTDLDNVLYPTKGVSGYISLLKRGLQWKGGINMFAIEAEINKFIPLGKNWFTSFQLSGRLKSPFDLAYVNQRALGFGNTYLRGQEYYAIDAVAYGIAKINLKKQITRFNIKTPLKSRNLQKIPFRLLAKTYTDLGYAYNKPGYISRLNNKFLYTGGFGLDVITLFDIQIRFEYSFNQLGQNGLFLHNQAGF